MSTNDADRLLTAWLESVAPAREPEHLLGDVLARTARTRRRPAWRIPERWIPMTTITTQAAAGRRFPWQLAAVVGLLVLAIVAGAVLLAGARPVRLPPPFGLAANGALVYASGGDLYRRDLLAGTSTLLVGDPGMDIGPAFAPDGTRLLFLRAADAAAVDADRLELRVAAPDGTGSRGLGEFTGITSVAWAPDGTQIAVASQVDGLPAITLVSSADGAATRLDVAIPAESPAFRPGDGRQLAFRGQAADGSWGLYLVGSDGSGLARLDLDLGFGEDRYYDENLEFYFLAPAWAPDGRRLAFHTLEPSLAEDPGFRVHVAEVGPAGAVTGEAVLGQGTVVDDEFDASWLPDGSGLVVHRVEESIHTLVRSPAEADGPPGSAPDSGAQPSELSAPRYPHEDFFDLGFVVGPDGRSVLAWSRGLAQAWQLDLAGGPTVLADLEVSDLATWQRLAP